MEIFYGDLDVSFVASGIYAYHTRQPTLERIGSTAHVQDPLMWIYFAGHDIVTTISIGILTGLPVIPEIFI
jgi:hypothetical protein